VEDRLACAVAEAAPFVVVVGGIPGAGKTALAERLVPALRARAVSRDVIRAAMFVPLTLTDAEKFASFRAVLEAVGCNCELGATTIVEGMPFSRIGELEEVRERAAAAGIPTYSVWLDVPLELARSRVAADVRDGVPMADDRVERVAEVAKRFRPWPRDGLVLDGSRSLDQLTEEVLTHLARARAQVGG
jgi:predicted kinase